jgi:hypothetical protein
VPAAASPARKKQSQNQEDESMDESSSSQAWRSSRKPIALGGATHPLSNPKSLHTLHKQLGQPTHNSNTKQPQQHPEDTTSPEQPEIKMHPALPMAHAPGLEKNEPIGDNMVELPKGGSMVRVFYQNHHWRQKNGKLIQKDMEHLKQKQVVFITLTETNNTWKNGLIKECFCNAVNREWSSIVLESDHQGLYIDIDIDADAFHGKKQQDNTRPVARLLKLTDK